MRKFSTPRILFITLTLLIASCMYGCREAGCTNPKAINYNSVADDDDGSCIVCTTTTEETDNTYTNLVDNNWSSNYYNQVVARFYFTQTTFKYNNNGCGTNLCSISYTIENLTNKEMDFSYYLFTSGFINFSTYPYKNVSIPAYQTTNEVKIQNVTNPCGSLASSSITINLNNYITYH